MAMKFEKVSDGKYMLDVCGYVCPHPQIYTKKSLEKIDEGDILELVFDNPSSGDGTVRVTRTITHPNGTFETERWAHRYNPMPED